MRTLIIPYFIWNIFWTTMAVFLSLNEQWVNFEGGGYFIWDYKINSILKGIFLCRYNNQYWYILNLIILLLFTPIIKWIVEDDKRWIITVVIIAVLIKFDITVPMFALWGVFYYIYGAYVSMKAKELSNNKRGNPYISFICLVCVCILVSIFFNQIPNILYRVIQMLGLALFWNALDLFKNIRIHWIMEMHFFIYSFHNAPEYILNKYFASIFPEQTIPYMFIVMFIGIVSSLLLSIIVAKVLMVKTPRVYSILTGGRKFINSVGFQGRNNANNKSV